MADYDPLGLKTHIDYLKSRFQEDPELEVCQLCHFPTDFHIPGLAQSRHAPEYWPASHAIRYLELELNLQDA